MTEYFVPALEPAATAGNLTNLIAERAWFEPERIMASRPLGDGWQPVTARELEAEIRAQFMKHLLQNRLTGFSLTQVLWQSLLRRHNFVMS